MENVSAKGQDRWRFALWFGLVGMLILFGYASRAGGAKPPADALYRYGTALSGTIAYAVLLGVVLLLGRGGRYGELFALRRPASWPAALGLALGTYVVIVAGAGLLLRALGAGGEQGLTPEDWDPARAGAYAANFILIAIFGPVVEELLYRGAGLSLFLRFGTVAAVIVTALPFALGHGLVRAMPALLLFGVAIALLRLRTRSLYPAILVHCAFNATSLILAVAV